MTAEKKVDKEALKKALWQHIKRSEAFKMEVMNGADFHETAEKYGKKFVNPLPLRTKK